jgi:glucosamine kinase
MVACGTGVVGEVLDRAGKRLTVSAWGFPYGDEGSGAWLGQRAVALAMHTIDGRALRSPLSDAIRERCGNDRFALLDWTFTAGQGDFASLAPMVFQHAAADPAAEALLASAARELDRVVAALDPDNGLPVAVLGSIGQRLAPRLDCSHDRRLRPARGTALDGACLLFSHSLEAWS